MTALHVSFKVAMTNSSSVTIKRNVDTEAPCSVHLMFTSSRLHIRQGGGEGDYFFVLPPVFISG